VASIRCQPLTIYWYNFGFGIALFCASRIRVGSGKGSAQTGLDHAPVIMLSAVNECHRDLFAESVLQLRVSADVNLHVRDLQVCTHPLDYQASLITQMATRL